MGGWLSVLGAIGGKYADYKIADKQADSQAALAAQIAASQAAQQRTTAGGNTMLYLGLGAAALVAVVFIARS
jgi:hypothetical protein